MKRRNFLKLLGVSPIVPSVLMAKETIHDSLMRQGFRPLRIEEREEFEKLLNRYQLEMAERAANPAALIHPDGRIEPIKSEDFWEQVDSEKFTEKAKAIFDN